MPPRKPLVTLNLESLPSSPSEVSDDSDVLQRRWYHHIPPCGIVGLIIAPHPSLLYVLVDYHLLTLRQPLLFATHLLITYTLTFLAFSSLLVCVVRDPGPANVSPASNGEGSDEMGLTEALMTDIDFSTPGRWCRKCWAPKPERTHHCSQCGRCVLKMDHHCPWLGFRCIGHRTYPAFIHFLCSVTLLSTYVAVISISALWYAFHNPLTIHETTPVHELILAFTGIIFALIIGSFFAYHVYLVLTNQTTIENLSPFLLLRHLPPLSRTGHSLSDPPLEPELSYPQRRLVKDAHREIFLYDVGWRRNCAQVFGWNRRFGWLHRVWCGGASTGDGKYFPRNPRAEEMMASLATELVKADRSN